MTWRGREGVRAGNEPSRSFTITESHRYDALPQTCLGVDLHNSQLLPISGRCKGGEYCAVLYCTCMTLHCMTHGAIFAMMCIIGFSFPPFLIVSHKRWKSHLDLNQLHSLLVQNNSEISHHLKQKTWGNFSIVWFNLFTVVKCKESKKIQFPSVAAIHLPENPRGILHHVTRNAHFKSLFSCAISDIIEAIIFMSS